MAFVSFAVLGKSTNSSVGLCSYQQKPAILMAGNKSGVNRQEN